MSKKEPKDVVDWTQVPDVIKIDSKDVLEKTVEKKKKAGRPTHAEILMRDGQASNRAGVVRYKNKDYWPVEKRIEAVTLFAAGVTSNQEISKFAGIPAETVKEWKRSEWWPEMMSRVHDEMDQELDSKLTKVIEAATEQLLDRITEGDFIVDYKNGVVKGRRPMNSVAIGTIAGIVIDKRQILRGRPTQRVETVAVDERLNRLADEFRRFTGAKTIEHIPTQSDDVYDATEGTGVDILARPEESPSGIDTISGMQEIRDERVLRSDGGNEHEGLESEGSGSSCNGKA